MIRTFLRRWDRFRIPAIIVCVCLVVGGLFLARQTFGLLMGFQPGAEPAIVVGMAMGAGMGLIFGLLIYQSLEFLGKTVTGDFRAERLMLKYHDALLEMARSHASAIAEETPVEKYARGT